MKVLTRTISTKNLAGEDFQLTLNLRRGPCIYELGYLSAGISNDDTVTVSSPPTALFVGGNLSVGACDDTIAVSSTSTALLISW